MKRIVKHIFYDCPRPQKRIMRITTQQIITPLSAVEELNANLRKKADQRSAEETEDILYATKVYAGTPKN